MPDAEEIPLIYTTMGNVPISSLEHYVRWDQADDYIKFVEIYMHQGVVVRESAHVLAKTPAPIGAEQAAIA